VDILLLLSPDAIREGKMKSFLACLIVPTILMLLVTLFAVGALYFFVANLLDQHEAVNE
jgi:hypothetical protein